jgi:hypothetical protein
MAGKGTEESAPGKNLFKEDENSGLGVKWYNQLNAWMAGKQYSGGVSNAPGGKFQVPDKGTMVPGSNADTGFKIKVKAGQSKFEYDDRLQSTINKLVDSNFPISYISGINDQYHHDKKKGSKHTEGKALDFILSQVFKDAKEGDDVASKMSSLLAGARVQYEDAKRDGVDASHFHMELMQKGGITTGPSIAGEAGPEAVVPLPDGRSIPVQIDMSAMIDKLDQLLSVMKDQHSTSEQILYAQS